MTQRLFGARYVEEDGWVAGGRRDHRAISPSSRGTRCPPDGCAGRPGWRHLRRDLPERGGRAHEHVPSRNRRRSVRDQVQRERRFRVRTGPTDVPLRFGDSPTGDDAYTRWHPERHVFSTWELPVLRGDARADGRPGQLRREANSEAVHAQDPAAAMDRLVSRRPVSVGGGSAFPYGSTSPRRLRHLRVDARLGSTPRGTQALSDGTIEGTPRSNGTYRFTTRAEDTEGRTVGWKVELAIASRLRVHSRQLPRAQTGRTYRADLASVGGIGPTTWKLTRGRLPRGLRLESARGRLTGSPTEAGTHVFTVEVRDALRVTVVRAFRSAAGLAQPRPRDLVRRRAGV